MELYDYQQKIVDNYKGGGIALFMDMGTGKTITSLSCFKKSGCHKLLVVCLATKTDDWTKEDNSLNIVALNKASVKKNIELLENNNMVSISFERVWRLEKEIMKWIDKDTFVIIDESHKIKNPKSKVSKMMLRLSNRIEHSAILTGTPQSQGYIDYYSQLRFIKAYKEPLKVFEDKYCVIRNIPFNGFPVKTIVGYKNTDKLDQLIKSVAIYKERELDNNLIPSERVIEVKAPRLYKSVMRDHVYINKNDDEFIYDTVGSRLGAARSMVGGTLEGDVISGEKIKHVKALCDELEGERIVVFYNLNSELEQLKTALKGIRPVSEYNGHKKDTTNFDKFSNGVILCQYLAASTGINNLVKSAYMVFYSLPFSVVDYRQAKGRIDRIGQTRKPMYIHMVMKNTLEEQVYRNLQAGVDFDEQMFEKIKV